MVLHEAPVSVLVARAPFDPAGFPARIVAGFDGSPESRRALDAAARLRDRSGGGLTVVTASEDAGAAAAPEGLTGSYDVLVSRDRAVDALVEAAQTADLLVIGSRGMHGARALGSVSERVAHRASASVLVVRAPAET
jgi:nucleotide-binding universal stress UspA family protein